MRSTIPRILETALKRLQSKIRYLPLVFGFLPEKYILRQVQLLYETILYTTLDEYEMDFPHRPACKSEAILSLIENYR